MERALFAVSNALSSIRASDAMTIVAESLSGSSLVSSQGATAAVVCSPVPSMYSASEPSIASSAKHSKSNSIPASCVTSSGAP